MRKILTGLRRLSHHPAQSVFRSSSHPESPEAIILTEVNAFCESGGPNNTGDEFLHLPAIVEAAESSPNAAKEAANLIRHILSNPSSKKGYRQYNAVMLIRILVDNPGETFSRNFDAKFVSVIRDLLRDGRDMSVQQVLRETLEYLAVQKSNDPHLASLAQMWKKEKEKFERTMGVSAGPWVQPQIAGQRDNYVTHPHRNGGLPTPDELSARISEANTSASLLLQLVQSTPSTEFYKNDLLREFSQRCQAAARSIQEYINASNPAPDEDTMLTLIETNDKLAVAMSKYQRAALVARKHTNRMQSNPIDPNTTLQQPEQPETQQPHPQSLPPPDQVRNTDAQTAKRSGPLFSMSLKNLSKYLPDKHPQSDHQSQYQQPHHPSQTPRTPPSNLSRIATANTTPPSAVSPINTTPPQPPFSSTAPTSKGYRPPPPPNTTPSNPTYEYNSSDFQVENPFADTHSSSRFDNNSDNGSHHGTRTWDTSRPRNLGADTQPVTSSTYYPNTGDGLPDSNMAAARGPDSVPGTLTGAEARTLSATERFYGALAGRKG
ncbi:hypothetical protein PAAG_05369 [Paracoccidioides lutzii Pb01]|uniref:GAT domain-containing protein n=1 Tax=Paracoccidioides lutzii (strain ATCC MYA-826 / Pb01) TaxID=502779 RepID=C1H3M6_PARBA|nr:hypothetical protein PAAG_05369 [Paracoccidioides lutzii Pb01]EEH34320.1 hypothetical protein PAAG_05369 [Paracoccidioides lutzii Pb01]